MPTLSKAPAAPEPRDDSLESLGLSGKSLMQLYGIGVDSVSDLTGYTTDSLRTRLADSLSDTPGVRARVGQVIQDIHAALRARHASLKPMSKAGGDKENTTKIEVQYHSSGFEPEHEWLDESNATVPLYTNDVLELFYRDMRKYKALSRDEQTELGRRCMDEKDMQARDLLVLHNLRLVLWVARKYLSVTIARKKEWSALEFADLVQEGVLGLMIAAERYDYRLGFTFATYAIWSIRQGITRAIMDSGFIRIPVHMGEKLLKIRRVMNKIAIREGRPPSVTEIAKEAELDPKEVKTALKAGWMQIDSFDVPANPDGGERFDDGKSSMYERIADEGALRADHILEAREELDAACARLNRLTEALYEDDSMSERNREIFIRFYGLDGSLKKRTLESVAERYDITRERTRQLIASMWERLQYAVDMDHESVLGELTRIGALEKLAHKKVSRE